MKNTILTFIFLTLIGFVATSQNISTTPLYPTANDEITLIFDATDTPLEGYNGQMYTHTGVGIDGGNNWQYVIGDWGNNSNQPELTSLGNDLWELLITPSIYEFYEVPSNLDVINLSFVFRNADADKQTGDLFIPIFGNELQVIYYWGEGEAKVLEGDTYRIHAVSPQADSMFLFIDDELIYSTNEVELEYETEVTSEYGYWNPVPVSLMAVNATDTILDEGTLTVFPEPTIEERPADVVDGINYIDNSTVILSLYAPEKDFVFVIGDFNDWEVVEENYMKKTPDGERYWVTIENLTPNQEYAFQYLIDENLRVADAYADKVLDPWNDQYIPSSTYPNLKPYPDGKTTGIVSVLETNQPEYQWQVTNFEAPEPTDLVVYELLLRDFVDAQNFQTLTDTLSYLKRLGVNAIEVMPFNEFEGNLSWGYNPSFYFAPDKFYGTKDALKGFIDACHAEGIAVIMDIVLNHAYSQNVFARMYWDDENNRPAENNPWFNAECPHEYCWGSDFDHESPATQAFVDRINAYWLNEYKIDGFRYDFTQGFTNNNSNWSYDQDRIDIIKRMSDYIWSVKDDAYVILEHWTENSEETVLANYGCMLWANMSHSYNEGTMGWNEDGKSDFSWISYQERGWNMPHVMGFMESHDEERNMYKNITWGNSSGNYDITDTITALERQALAASFFYTIPGPKMIWQFGELGYDYSINWPSGEEEDRLTPKPPRWDYMDHYKRRYLYNVHAALIDLKKNYDVFRTTDYSLDLDLATKSITLRGSDMNVVVVGNFGVENYDHAPDWPNTGTWYEFFTQSQMDVNSTNQLVNLERGEYRIYTTEFIEKPEWLNTSVEEIPESLVESTFSVSPNPTKGNVYFDFELSNTSDVIIDIYDLTGKKLTEINRGELGAGKHQVNWNATGKLRSGLYFAMLRIGMNTESIKFVVE